MLSKEQLIVKRDALLQQRDEHAQKAQFHSQQVIAHDGALALIEELLREMEKQEQCGNVSLSS